MKTDKTNTARSLDELDYLAVGSVASGMATRLAGEIGCLTGAIGIGPIGATAAMIPDLATAIGAGRSNLLEYSRQTGTLASGIADRFALQTVPIGATNRIQAYPWTDTIGITTRPLDPLDTIVAGSGCRSGYPDPTRMLATRINEQFSPPSLVVSAATALAVTDCTRFSSAVATAAPIPFGTIGVGEALFAYTLQPSSGIASLRQRDTGFITSTEFNIAGAASGGGVTARYPDSFVANSPHLAGNLLARPANELFRYESPSFVSVAVPEVHPEQRFVCKRCKRPMHVENGDCHTEVEPCECIVLDFIELRYQCSATGLEVAGEQQWANPRNDRPTWYRGTIRGGGRRDGPRRATGRLHLIRA